MVIRVARFNYQVVVGDEVDDEVLRSDTDFEVGDVVPFKGDKAIVERIEELGRAAWGSDASERADPDPGTAIFRRLHCRLSD